MKIVYNNLQSKRTGISWISYPFLLDMVGRVGQKCAMEKIPTEGGIDLDNKSMMELGEELNGKFNDLVGYCMVSGAIDLDLYNEYDVKNIEEAGSMWVYRRGRKCKGNIRFINR